MEKKTCAHCNGARLKDIYQWYQIDNKDIGEITNMDIESLEKWIIQLKSTLDPLRKKIAKDLLKELISRLGFLMKVGLEYLQLNLPAATL